MPQRKRAAVKIAEGNAGGRNLAGLRAQAAAEVRPVRGLGPAPKELGKVGRRHWAFVADQIGAMKLDASADRGMLIALCSAFEQATLADADVRQRGQLFEKKAPDETGVLRTIDVRANPSVEISRKAWALYSQIAGKFGLSPQARVSVSAPQEQRDFMAELHAICSQPRVRRPMPTIGPEVKHQ